MAGDIILGYDNTDGSRAALRAAVPVAAAFEATLTVVFGYEPNPMGGETGDYQRQLEKIGTDAVASAIEQAGQIDPSVRAESLVVAARPVEALLAAAEQREARVIVVGGNGERPIVAAILGSTPHKLLGRSKIPVLVAPALED